MVVFIEVLLGLIANRQKYSYRELTDATHMSQINIDLRTFKLFDMDEPSKDDPHPAF